MEAPAKAKSPSNAVADLERRLAMLANGGDDIDDPPPAPPAFDDSWTPAPPPPPPAAAPAAPAATGKNALLARIMAAQEKAKTAKPPPPPPDIFNTAPPPPATSAPPAFNDSSAPPAPPAFDDNWNPAPPPPPEEEAPPAFDMLGDAFDDLKPPAPAFQAPAYPTSNSWATAPPAPSAPTFEDLQDGGPHFAPSMDELPPPPMPYENEYYQPYQNQQQQSQAEIEAEFMAGLEGLSDAEKREMLEEQRLAMAQLEKNKVATGAPLSAAGYNSLREESQSQSQSQSAGRKVKLGENQEVALHGQERTRAAIQDGTAILTQCVNCSSWMQVTDNATLMFCPTCQVVSPVDRENAVTTKEEALQMEADRKMAEELQKEFYTASERAERKQKKEKAKESPKESQSKEAAAKSGGSWWDWVGLGGGETTEADSEKKQSAAQSHVDVGVSRSRGSGLQAVQTGAGDLDGEDRSYGGSERKTKSKPMYASVTGSNDDGDDDAVGGSGLLAVSKVGRNQS